MMGDTGEKGLLLGITGGIACGKSEVGNILADCGFEVLDADLVARRLLEPGSDQYARVVEEFGRSILDPDGSIDRSKLAGVVFFDQDALARLNGIVHPETLKRCRGWIEQKRAPGAKLAVVMPLLFEVGETRLWDAIVCVYSDRGRVIERLKRRGLTSAEAERRIDAQMPLELKLGRSDYVISNEGSLSELAETTDRVIGRIMEKMRGNKDG